MPTIFKKDSVCFVGVGGFWGVWGLDKGFGRRANGLDKGAGDFHLSSISATFAGGVAGVGILVALPRLGLWGVVTY